MEHLIIRSIMAIRPKSLPEEANEKTELILGRWVGKHSTTENTKTLCREYKKACGWKKYRVHFSEFDCRSGRLVIRVSDIKN